MQTIALWCIGQVTLTQSFVETLLYVKQFHFALASLSVLPFILLYALCPIGSGSGWLCGIVGLSATIILLFLREIHSLFVAKIFRICIGFCTFAPSKSHRWHLRCSCW